MKGVKKLTLTAPFYYFCFMNLIIDIGNTSIKLAVYDNLKKILLARVKKINYPSLKKKLSHYKIDRAIISSVKEVPDSLKELLSISVPAVYILSHKSRLPFKIDYKTPETLGSDRIAAVTGAYNIFPGADVLIIDAGTAVTYDFLSGNTYKGGNISPGLRIRFMALNKFTGKLPLVVPTYDYIFPGTDTTNAIEAGVITGLTYEINEYIRTFKKLHSRGKIIMTGGDSAYLKDKINYKVIYEPDIVTDGLNYILNYNAE